jgi:hypothetical protein
MKLNSVEHDNLVNRRPNTWKSYLIDKKNFDSLPPYRSPFFPSSIRIRRFLSNGSTVLDIHFPMTRFSFRTNQSSLHSERRSLIHRSFLNIEKLSKALGIAPYME